MEKKYYYLLPYEEISWAQHFFAMECTILQKGSETNFILSLNPAPSLRNPAQQAVSWDFMVSNPFRSLLETSEEQKNPK